MNQKQPHIVDVIFVLALFGLFSLSSLFLITAGSEIYHNTVKNMDRNYELRTSTSYLTEKVRHSKNTELIELKGEGAIALREIVNDTEYVTYLYYYDGYLRELHTIAGTDLGDSMLAAGQKITQLDHLSFNELSNGLIQTELVFSDKTNTTLLLNATLED